MLTGLIGATLACLDDVEFPVAGGLHLEGRVAGVRFYLCWGSDFGRLWLSLSCDALETHDVFEFSLREETDYDEVMSWAANAVVKLRERAASQFVRDADSPTTGRKQ